MCDGVCGGFLCSPSCEYFSTEDGVCAYSDEEERKRQDAEEEATLDSLNQLVLSLHNA